MFRITFIFVMCAAAVGNFGCGSRATPNVNAISNSNSNSVKEIKLDPANMPPGISLNSNVSIGNKPIPGIPNAEQLKKGIKPGKATTPGIPGQETIRKQMGYPTTNVNLPKK